MKMLPAPVVARFSALNARVQAMPVRDRRALFALSIFFVGVIGWLGVVSPVIDYARESKETLAQAEKDYAWMQVNAAVARQAGAHSGQLAAGQSLLTAVNSSARSSGLNLQRFEPDGEQRVRVTLENAVFTDVMRWIVTLQTQYGLRIDSFHADHQGKPGIVNIRLTVGRSS